MRILIVEDHEPTREAIATLLRGELGRAFALEGVADAESALQSVAQARPDLVLMDISLPGMNGIEATRRLLDIDPAVPVVIHSRSDTQVYRTMAAEVGVRAFISKARTAEELAPSIRRILTPAPAK